MLRHRIGENVRGEISFRLAAIVVETDRGITPEDLPTFSVLFFHEQKKRKRVGDFQGPDESPKSSRLRHKLGHG